MYVLLISFLILLIIEVPIGFSLLGASLMYMIFIADFPLEIIIQRIMAGTQSFPLIAVPLFILTGNLLNISGISKRIMTFSQNLTANITGGLAQVNVILSTLLAGMSGSANADAAMQAKILVPQMIKRNYPAPFSSVLTAASSLIAPLIPPSIGLIVYGFVANVSIARLFMGGIIPGILITFFLMILVYIIVKKQGYGTKPEKVQMGSLLVSFKQSFPALMLPLIIILGIRFGVATPTEVGAGAAVYAFVLGLLYREMTWEKIIECFNDTVRVTAAIMLIISASGIFSFILTIEKVPQNLTNLLLGTTNNPILMIYLIFILLLIIGMFIEGTAAIIILAPILMPVINELQIDPVHFGVVMVFSMLVGGITPPVGTIMYTVCSITKVSVTSYIVENVPFLILFFIIGIILCSFPWLVTFLAYI